jgi:hypothetical protein
MVANADCYLIPPLVWCSVPVAAGLARLLRGPVALAAALLALLANAAVNFHACDRSGFDAGDGWSKDLDASAPQRSVILLKSWDQRMLATFYRDRGFRTDLVVLPYDVKGTNHECARFAYPEFTAALQPEYDAWLAQVAAVDPDYVFTDYPVSSKAQADALAALWRKLFLVAVAEGRTVLMDFAATDFLVRSDAVKPEQVQPCGILFALGQKPAPPPLRASGRWWEQPFLLHDLCAAVVLRDYQHVAERSASYWKFHGDQARQQQTAAVVERIRRIADAYRADKPFLGWKDSAR